jgi:hypothetical protein
MEKQVNEMKKALRILALLMAIGMILGVMCSCGGGGETSESKQESSESQTESTGSEGSESTGSQGGESTGSQGGDESSETESEPIDTTPSIEVDTDGVDTEGEWSDHHK